MTALHHTHQQCEAASTRLPSHSAGRPGRCSPRMPETPFLMPSLSLELIHLNAPAKTMKSAPQSHLSTLSSLIIIPLVPPSLFLTIDIQLRKELGRHGRDVLPFALAVQAAEAGAVTHQPVRGGGQGEGEHQCGVEEEVFGPVFVFGNGVEVCMPCGRLGCW